MLRLLSVSVALVATITLTDIPCYVLVFLASLLYLITGGLKWLQLLSRVLMRDTRAIWYVMEMVYVSMKIKRKNMFIRDVLSVNVRKHPNKLAFVDADTKKSLTFKEVEELSHKIANIFYEAGYRRGDVVALYMENRVEYISVLIGLSSIGVTTSLINYNLRGDSLKHCIDVCNCKSVIFSQVTSGSVVEIEDDLKVDTYCFDSHRETRKSWMFLDALMASASCLPPPRSPDIAQTDTFVYIYTSGTTGFPKAVIMKHRKFLRYTATRSFGVVKDRDILYNALPLYHSNGLCMTSLFLLNGCTSIIKKKFSASQYIEDCCKYNVTVVNYIGETCRYLLCQPKSVFDDLNNIRLAVGNGLRASVWMEFKERFKIEKVLEIYGSTEQNTGIFPNIEGRVGAVGFRPLLLPANDIKLMKIDAETGEIIRDAKGIAENARLGEPGQLVGKITKYTPFDGYTNKESTKKKIAHDIFSLGDSAFLTGDILVKDEEGYYYFRDRTGDTFRWKGENVSTNEVEGLISKVTQLTDVCVYGVPVPGNEGKAGMACIVDPHKKLSVDNLPQSLDQLLPKYAQPVFLRLSSSVHVTGTYKFQKNKLKEEGYAPGKGLEGDELYYLSKKENMYALLDDSVYERIMSGDILF